MLTNVLGRRPHGRGGIYAVLPAVLLLCVGGPASTAGETPPPLRPAELNSYFTQADYWLRRREPDHALAVLRQAAGRFPKEARVHLSLAGLLSRRGSFGEAAEQYAAAARLQPKDTAPLFGLAQAEYQARHYPAAESALRRVIRLDPRSAPAYARLGMIYTDTFATEKALASCRKALELDPGSAEAHYYLAEALRRLRRLDEAEPHARQALSAAPNNARIYVTLGRIYLERPDTEANRSEALGAFKQAVSLDPTRAEAQYSLGLLYQRARNWPEAEKALLQAVRLRPDMAPAQYTLSQVERRLGKGREADLHLAAFQRLRKPSSGAAQ